MKFKRWALALLTAAALALAAGAALAAVGEWAESDPARVRLIASNTDPALPEAVRLGIHFELRAGWKTYWRHAGDAGVPPGLDWSGSENLTGFRLHWPAPRRFSAFGFDSFGYDEELVLPVTARRIKAGAATKALLRLDYLTCKDVCILVQEVLELDLNLSVADLEGTADLIDQYRARVPMTGGRGGIKVTAAAVEGRPGAQVLRVTAEAKYGFQAPDLMVEAGENFRFSRPEIELSENGQMAVLSLKVLAQSEPALDLGGQPLTLTLVDGTLAAEKSFLHGALSQ